MGGRISSATSSLRQIGVLQLSPIVPNRGAAIHRSPGSFTSELLANKVDMMVWDQVSMENVGSGSARC